MASILPSSTNTLTTQNSPKESKASMSINNMLNGTSSQHTRPSQLPTPDISPNQPAINDLSKIPSATETLKNSTPARDRDYLLLSPSQTELSPPLFQAPHSRTHSRLPSRTRDSLPQAQSRNSVIEPSNGLAGARNPSVSSEPPMPDQMFRLVSVGPENPNDPDGPREAVLQSQAWSNAANHPEQYREMLIRTNRATYASMQAPALNILADVSVAALEPRNRPLVGSRARRQPRQQVHDLAEPLSTVPAPSRQTRRKRRGSEDQGEATPPKRQRSEAQKKKKYHSFMDIVDYCPDISTEALARPFEIEQMSNKIDLSNEPQDLRERMTATELNMASNLRLNCNNFLINKRLIFRGKVEHIISGAPFSKTHAQLYGVIDVNKASKMFSYFSAAGWMEESVLAPFVVKEKALQKQMKVEDKDTADIQAV